MQVHEAINSEIRERLRGAGGLRADEAAELLRPICAALEADGIYSAQLQYSGHGGEGSVDEIEWSPITDRVPDELRVTLEEWVTATLPVNRAEGQGGQGIVIVSTSEPMAWFYHEKNVAEVERVEFEIGKPRLVGSGTPSGT